jgi:hypothetical protein
MTRTEQSIIFGFVFIFTLAITGWTSFQIGYDDGMRTPLQVEEIPFTLMAAYSFKGTLP